MSGAQPTNRLVLRGASEVARTRRILRLFKRPSNLFICAVALVLVAFVGSAALIVHRRSEALNDASLNFDRLSIAVAEQTAQSFASVNLVLNSLTEDLQHRRDMSPDSFEAYVSSREFHDLLLDEIKGVPQIETFALADADGQIISNSQFWPLPEISVADRDYFQELKRHPDTRTFISGPARSRVSGSWTVYVARAWSVPGEPFHGVMMASIKLDYFSQFFRLLSGPEELYISLRLKEGGLLAQVPDRKLAIGSMPRNLSVMSKIARGEQQASTFTADVDGRVRLRAARTVEGFPLIVVVSRTERAILADWRRDSATVALCSFGAVAFGILLMLLARQNGRDLADRIRAEQADSRAAAAEEANQLKTKFLANMSHELRTPLNAVIGFSEVMKAEMMGPIGQPAYRGYADDIHSAGIHLLDIINSVLDFTKADAGKATLAPTEFDPGDLVRRVCRMVAWKAEKGGVTVHIDVDGVVQPLLTDECKLRQSVLNILSNAVKFTPAGGSVTIVARSAGEAVEIVVTDTGIGIAESDIPTVFAAFGQVDNGLDRAFEGSGLGVPLAATNVRLMGGTMELRSQLGRGTEVTIRVPSSKQRRRNASQDERYEIALGGGYPEGGLGAPP